MQRINEILYTIGNGFTNFIGIFSGILTIISVICAIKDKEHRKLYIIGICLSFVLWLCLLYTNKLTSVPNVVGRYYNDACSILSEKELNYETINTPNDFKVIRQNVAPGKIVKRGSLIKLEIKKINKNQDVLPTPSYVPDTTTNHTNTPMPTNKPTKSSDKSNEKIKRGQNPHEAKKLMKYINNYRKRKGLAGLKWNVIPEKEAKKIAKQIAKNKSTIKSQLQLVARRCNGAKNAEKVVLDWINGNQYIPSESNKLLKKEYTTVGGALYYLPDGDKNNYHYFWVVCFY